RHTVIPAFTSPGRSVAAALACRGWRRDLRRHRRAATLAVAAALLAMAVTATAAAADGAAAEQAADTMGVWAHLDRALPLGLGLIILLVGRVLVYVPPNQKLGIRTRWTLADEEVWLATHRLAGRTFAAGG